jgi:Tol biopolymer transport system component
MSPRGTWIACVSGNWLAYILGPLFENAAASSVVLFPASGGAPIDLTGADKEYSNPAWTADGKFLWMLSNRDGVPNEVYSIRIGSDGKRSGEFTKVGLNAQSMSLSRNRIVYSVTAHKANVWTLPIPTDTAVTLANAKQITSGNQVIEVINVSADGKWLIYDSDIKGNADIWRMPLPGGEPERLTDDPRAEYAADLSPDGKEIVWQRFVKDGLRHLMVKSLDSDVARELFPDEGDKTVGRWSPSGDAIVAWRHDTEEGGVFTTHRDGKGGWTKPRWLSKDGTVPMWSPDGRTIAMLLYSGQIDLIPADSGPRTVAYAARRGTRDPKAVLMRWGEKPGMLWFVGQQPDGASGIWELHIPGGGRPVQRVRFDDASGKSLGIGFAVHGANFYFPRDERSANVRWGELVSH